MIFVQEPPAARTDSETSSFISVFGMLLDFFPGRERWTLARAFAVSFVAALFETVGVASILPFMALVIDPSLLGRSATLQSLVRAVGVVTPRGELLLAGAVTALIVGVGNAAGAINIIVQQRFGARTLSRLSTDLFRGYLNQPYSFHVERDGPSLMKLVLNDASVVVNGVITQIFLGVSKGFMAMGIIAVLFLQDPFLALVVSSVLGTTFVATFMLGRVGQHRLGVRYSQHNLDRQRVAQEAFGGIKDLQLLGREEYAIERFRIAARESAASSAASTILGQTPRYALETVAFGGILVLTLVLVAGGRSSAQEVVPVLSLYAFAGYRFLPAINQVFYTAVSLRFSLPSVREFHRDLRLVTTAAPHGYATPSVVSNDLHFENALRLDDVTFTYIGSRNPAIQNVSLAIRPNESVGFVGQTGAGKTTLADLILGFYEPSAGHITVDGVPLSSRNIRSWRQRVGYVPQQVFLANASVADNIAFGLPPTAINMDAVRNAARLAQASEFIESLPEGFSTLVGERGVKLSGGQRQRIGIARALYGSPELLVFDEATSALDGLTEDAVMDAIRTLRGDRTVIVIAHRLRTVEACDRVIMVQGGRIVADGSYDQLLETSLVFRRLAGKAAITGTGVEA